MIKIGSGNQLRGQIKLPASKSISNRALLINALGRSTMLPCNLSDSDDTRVMLRALQAISPLKEGRKVIDIGAAGTAMRFLTAYLSVISGEHIITGTERMKQRPIGILVDALRKLGASIEYEGKEGFPPLRIVGKELAGGELSLPADVSSQYISALLMIGPVMHNGLTLNLIGHIASRPYIDMTLAVMTHSGAKTAWTSASSLHVEAGGYTPKPYFVESDWSAASYWYEMVALTPDEAPQITLPGLFSKSLQGDSAVSEIFRPLGVETTFLHLDDGAEAVRLSRIGKPCTHLELDFNNQPDLAQTLIVSCAMLGTTFRFSGLASLKIKETDRIAALQAELRKLGIVIREDGDSIVYWDGERCEADREPAICTYEDHRMAMAFAPVCLRLGGQIQINNPEVVSKSYPAFWDDLQEVGFRPTPSPSLVGRGADTTGRLNTPLPTREGLGVGPERSSWCCGQHEVCEKESLLAIGEDIEYYEDEELDRFRGRTTYSEEEIEEFREVLYTMRTDEVAGWVHSLELRRVNLPDELKDEVFLLIDN